MAVARKPAPRRTANMMAQFGIPQPEVREELDRGVAEANAKMAPSLFQMAAQGKDIAAAIFWLKVRAG